MTATKTFLKKRRKDLRQKYSINFLEKKDEKKNILTNFQKKE